MSKLISGRTFPVLFEGYEIQLRVLSGEADDLVAELARSFATATDRKEVFRQSIELCVASWPWEGSLRSVLTDRECWDLIGMAREGAALTPDERKKFVSPSTSPTG